MEELYEDVNCEANESQINEKEILEGTNVEFVELTQEEVNEGLKTCDKDETTAKERLYNEIAQLSERIDKLAAYIRGRDENGIRNIIKDDLTDAQVYLLNTQLETMHQYYNILVARYSIFDVRRGEPGGLGITGAVRIVKE